MLRGGINRVTLTNELVLMLINIFATGVAGFLLGMHLYIKRFQIKKIWHWLGASCCGFVTGTVFAFIALLIDWP